MPLYDFKCVDHGFFEAFKRADDPPPACPECGGAMAVVWLQAPAMQISGLTKHTDALYAAAAQNMGVSDIYHTYPGEIQADAQKSHAPRSPEQQEIDRKLKPRWGSQEEIKSLVPGRSMDFAETETIPPPRPEFMARDPDHKAPVARP